MWVFWHKKKSNGYFKCYKARLAGDGRSPIARVDCDETFIPTVKLATIRTVLTIAPSKFWLIHQLDVHNVFLPVIFMILSICISQWVSVILIT